MTAITEGLFALQDEGYRAFHARLIPDIPYERIIGVRTPDLRRYAKKVAKLPGAKAFLQELPHTYYEENNLHGALLNLLYHFTQIGWTRMGYVIGRFWGCMYIGWWDFFMPKNPAAGFLILLPGIAMTAAAYLIGYHNIYLSSFFGIRPNRKKTR